MAFHLELRVTPEGAPIPLYEGNSHHENEGNIRSSNILHQSQEVWNEYVMIASTNPRQKLYQDPICKAVKQENNTFPKYKGMPSKHTCSEMSRAPNHDTPSTWYTFTEQYPATPGTRNMYCLPSRMPWFKMRKYKSTLEHQLFVDTRTKKGL